MKRFVLIPETMYRQTTKIDTRDVLQSIKKPEQREMLKRYQLAQNILNNKQHPNNAIKMNEFHEMMQDFHLLRNRQGNASSKERQQQDLSVSKQSIGDNGDGDDNVDMSLIETFPDNQKDDAQKLIRLLRSRGNGLVSWGTNGEVTIYGKQLKGANITDLISNVIQPRSSQKIPTQFLNVLAEVNIPETLVKNRGVIKTYRKIKDNGIKDSASDVLNVSSTTSHHERIPRATKRKKADVNLAGASKSEGTLQIDWDAPL